MAQDCSFDVVSQVNMQSMDNAVNQAMKEISQRYDFKGAVAEITLEGNSLKFAAQDEFKLEAMLDVLRLKMVKAGISARALKPGKLEQASKGTVRQQMEIQTGIAADKARDIVASAQMLLSDFGGRVPDNMEDLLRLPGVGRKTANLILGDVYGQAGYVCDTHCIRITGLLGLTDGSKDPLKVEQQLRACIPPEESSNFCHRMVLHGRAVCVARRPDCAGCTLRDLCDYGKTVREP